MTQRLSVPPSRKSQSQNRSRVEVVQYQEHLPMTKREVRAVVALASTICFLCGMITGFMLK